MRLAIFILYFFYGFASHLSACEPEDPPYYIQYHEEGLRFIRELLPPSELLSKLRSSEKEEYFKKFEASVQNMHSRFETLRNIRETIILASQDRVDADDVWISDWNQRISELSDTLDSNDIWELHLRVELNDLQRELGHLALKNKFPQNTSEAVFYTEVLSSVVTIPAQSQSDPAALAKSLHDAKPVRLSSNPQGIKSPIVVGYKVKIETREIIEFYVKDASQKQELPQMFQGLKLESKPHWILYPRASLVEASDQF